MKFFFKSQNHSVRARSTKSSLGRYLSSCHFWAFELIGSAEGSEGLAGSKEKVCEELKGGRMRACSWQYINIGYDMFFKSLFHNKT